MNVALALMLAVIGIISAFDLVLAVWLLDPSSSSFATQEKNPIIVQLAKLTGDFSLVIPLKILGTMVSLYITYRIYVKDARKGFVICCGVFFFQLLLLLYLSFGHLL